MHRVFLVLFPIILFGTIAPSSGQLLEPSPYLSFSDSPFQGNSFKYFYLEDFEDQAFDVPGVVFSTDAPENFLIPPATFADSVDADDGLIDGDGTAGYGWGFGPFTGAQQPSSATFEFDLDTLSSLPTHAGVVWTDLGFNTSGSYGFGTVSFEVFDAEGNLFGTNGPFSLGDGSATGGTDEDRFFGAFNPAGISRIVLSVNSTDWQFDHLQYGCLLLGDVNQDGLINLLDIEPFVTLVTLGQFQAEADTNGDGVVNLLDVEPFVDLLTGD